jgi:hypothetical protein
MGFKAFLIRVSLSFLSSALKWVTERALPNFSALWAGVRPLSVGDTVLWKNVGNFLVLERRGSALGYEYKLVSISGINPWLLPLLSCNPRLMREAPMCWYRGSKGRCYLKKTGHPKLELKMPVLSARIHPIS